jgi:uroporphyrinogen-III synthase
VNRRPLGGRAIVVTRPAPQAASLARCIEDAGGRPLVYPAIAIEPLRSAALDARLDRLASFDLAIFISRNAVEQGLARLQEMDGIASLPRTAAVGAGTRKALEAHGLQGVVAPEGQADSDALLAEPALQAMAGKRVLIFRGEGGREVLASALRARGATVDYAECYRRVRPALDVKPLLETWSAGGVDAVTVSSGEGLANFAALLGEAGVNLLRAAPVFVPHPRVAAEARELGIRDVIVAGAGDDEMLPALVAYFGAAG